MNMLFNDRDATYNQLIIDMFHNGVVLHRKYRLLGVAYLLFMIGLVISVFAFVVATLIVHF